MSSEAEVVSSQMQSAPGQSPVAVPNPNTMSIIVTKGSLDWAYPPFILATTAAAMGLNVTMFFTFYGVDAACSVMMKNLIKKKGVASIEDLREMAVEAEIRMIACQMTMDLFEYSQDDMIGGLEIGGAATYIETATNSHINLFI